MFLQLYTKCEETRIKKKVNTYTIPITTQIISNNVKTQAWPLHVETMVHTISSIVNVQLFSFSQSISSNFEYLRPLELQLNAYIMYLIFLFLIL